MSKDEAKMAVMELQGLLNERNNATEQVGTGEVGAG
jgi:hypothetical protein